jgi:glutamyl-tRNA synthetase
MDKEIRTRFAPSPTGHLHIGNARTAIMNWIFTRHHKGKFLLRIEDTDRDRSTEASEIAILEDLKWLGINWDEGPNIGGKFKPYRQSERIHLYQEYIRKLEDSGNIYPCYCTAEELDSRRKAKLEKGESLMYDGRCRQLTHDQRKKMEQQGKKPAFRFRVDEDEVTFVDLVKESISFRKENIGDFIVVRPDGMPIYNFACVVDDHLMEITHVIRGDDHISNTPKQLLMYKALKIEPPYFAHIPMILGKDRIRLSKRHGATSVSQFREMGYLPEAIINFLSLLSWSSESGDEILSKDRLIEEFDFSRVTKAASIFDVEKLDWMNGIYIRNKSQDELVYLVKPFLEDAGYSLDKDIEIQSIVALLHDKMERLSDIKEKSKIFFQSQIVPENDEAAQLLRTEESQKVLSAFLEKIESINSLNGESFQEIMKVVQDVTDVRGKKLWMPVRIALTGQIHGPQLTGIIEILGLDKCRKFIKEALGT